MPITTYVVPSNKIVHETKVDFSYRSAHRSIRIVQYDKQLPIIAVSLYVSGKPYVIPAEFDVNVKFGKRDKTFVYKPVLGCNADRTVVYFEMDQQMTLIHGPVSPILELSFVDGENVQRAGSSSIAIEIERNPIQESDIESTSEYIDLVESIIDNLENAIVDSIDNLELDVGYLKTSKQDKLVAGDNITIDENNVISASGGGGGSFYTKSTDIALNDTYYEDYSLQSDTVYVELIAHRMGVVQGTMIFSKTSLNKTWMQPGLPWTGQVIGLLKIYHVGVDVFAIDWNNDDLGSAAANYLTIIEHRFGDV